MFNSSIPVEASSGIVFAEVEMGVNDSCGRTAAGAAYCWGDNVFGESGDGTVTNRLVPTAVR